MTNQDHGTISRIEVTPEMIEAGEEALLSKYESTEIADAASELVADVYRAMRLIALQSQNEASRRPSHGYEVPYEDGQPFTGGS